jgi:hypothetical protein
MMRTSTRVFVVTLLLLCAATVLRAQSPTPIIVQAATSAPPTTAATPIAVTQPSADAELQAKLLRQMKADNEELLKKQEATLQRLDEIQKAAEQLKIFSKRG